MKTAILGVGSIIPEFLKAAAALDGLELYAIFGREHNLERMKELQEKHRICKIYHDYDELLADGQIEAVYVALPNHLHYSFALKALEKKKHVAVEKPFASTYQQAKTLVDAAAKNKCIVFEAISNQYMPNYGKTRELLSELGTVKIIQMNYSQYSRRYDKFKEGIILPVFDPQMAGGALMDLNVYNIHYILGLFGKPDAVHYTANVERGIDTSGILTMEYPSFQCVCVGAKDCKAPVSINIQGDRGYIHSDDPANAYNTFSFVDNDGKTTEYSLNGGMPRLYHEFQVFVDMVKKNDLELAGKYNQHSLDVMEILDEGRRQVNVALPD